MKSTCTSDMHVLMYKPTMREHVSIHVPSQEHIRQRMYCPSMHVLLSWRIYLQTISVNVCSIFWQVLLQSGSVMSHYVNVHSMYVIYVYIYTYTYVIIASRNFIKSIHDVSLANLCATLTFAHELSCNDGSSGDGSCLCKCNAQIFWNLTSRYVKIHILSQHLLVLWCFDHIDFFHHEVRLHWLCLW